MLRVQSRIRVAVVSASKNERLLNLLICLLSTKQFISAERIRRAVTAYGNDNSEKGQGAFQRKFERDKDELRELGVEIETGRNGYGDENEGYRIAGRDAKLPDITLTTAESTAVGIATELWKSAQFESASKGALLKLKAAGLTIDGETLGHLEPHMRADDLSFDGILSAVEKRTEIEFQYRGIADAQPAIRRFQPWGLASWKFRWYVVGFDVDRGEQRVFRLSRIEGGVTTTSDPRAFERPADLDLHSAIDFYLPPADQTATIRIHRGDAVGLRRMTKGVEQPTDANLIAVRYVDARRLAATVAPYGSDVEVVDPPEARRAVVDRLNALAGWSETQLVARKNG